MRKGQSDQYACPSRSGRAGEGGVVVVMKCRVPCITDDGVDLHAFLESSWAIGVRDLKPYVTLLCLVILLGVNSGTVKELHAKHIYMHNSKREE